MGDLKQVRVDNWGVFFLQRLQAFFSKTDYCDLTLQFEGNVQLKVHRLVVNACTEYFEFLEQSCPSVEENVILMPENLQADVIVPIVNFIYTGMLEFNMGLFERLYKAADLMNLPVLTKLLDAQRSSIKKKAWQIPDKKPATATAKTLATTSQTRTDLGAGQLPLVGRKTPVWKRKGPAPVPQALPSPFSESKWNSQDSADNTPKPTRFEWPDDDLPSLSLMDTSFDEISYTSKPLLTQAEDLKASGGSSFDQIKDSGTNSRISSINSMKGSEPSSPINIDEMKDYVKEQRIRSDLEGLDQDDPEPLPEPNVLKRKQESLSAKASPKRMRVEKENKETTVSVATKGGDLDHTKLVSEILKKYPHIVKKNKNIRLKIVSAGGKSGTVEAKISLTAESKETKPEKLQQVAKQGDVWVCGLCAKGGGDDAPEFQMFHMYKRHMIELHNQQFDINLCKYCGQKCDTQDVMMYHLFTRHGVKSPKAGSYPKCSQCPHVAISAQHLAQHKVHHSKMESRCAVCRLAFKSNTNLLRHMQITSHKADKPSKASYDCQFCTKKTIYSDTSLLAHIRNDHLAEARRDGVVLIDDDDLLGEEAEDQQRDPLLEDYILPMMEQDNSTKVKILSDVKVEATQLNPLEPSSEAEALSNVASGIATSLGLVDIVVLDDNQQYILPEEQQGGEAQQQEYLLSELESAGHQLQGGAGSTDELVMVLTDHDYQEGQEGQEAHMDNSNIVVLYSHPVEGGQQGQFITTSQGNILVNSETGMLEIRNGSTITTSSSQPIESIEMIQREIEKGTGTSGAFFEGVKSDEVAAQFEGAEAQEANSFVALEQDMVDGGQQFAEPMEVTQEVVEASKDILEEYVTQEYVEKVEEEQQPENGEGVVAPEGADEVGVREEAPQQEEQEQVEATHLEEAMEVDGKLVEEAATKEEEVLPAEIVEEATSLVEEIGEEHHVQQQEEEQQHVALDEVDAAVAAEEDGFAKEEEDVSQESVEEQEVVRDVVEEGDNSQSWEQPEEPVEETDSAKAEEEPETPVPAELVEEGQQGSGSKEATAILDDWEDTDSQQSEKVPSRDAEVESPAQQAAAEAEVHKLMDDWGEEEEDDDKAGREEET